MTNEEYHADRTAVSKSGLDWINKSPLHYWENYLNPNRPPRKKSKDLILGSATHVAITESYRFSSEYTLQPVVSNRTNEGKEIIRDFQEHYMNHEMLTQEMYEDIMGMRDAVYKHPLAADILSSGIPEHSFFWTDPVTGALVKCRPDWLSKYDIIADIKTCEDASPEGFGRSATKWRYHVQAPLYVDGFEACTGRECQGFVFIAVEKKPPYAVALYFTPPEVLNLGREIYRKNLEVYQKCKLTDKWPSYDLNITNLQLPQYAFNININN